MLLKVFYLDDEVDLCENFADYFSTEHIQVTAFSDPAAAIEAIKADPPDLLFVDFRLPQTTGDHVARLLDPTIPKFLITGDLMLKTEYPFLRIFTKPINEDEISNLLQTYFLKKIQRQS